MRKSSIFAILIAVCTLAGCNTGGIEPPIAPEETPQKEDEVKPAGRATVYGVVSCDGKGKRGLSSLTAITWPSLTRTGSSTPLRKNFSNMYSSPYRAVMR